MYIWSLDRAFSKGNNEFAPGGRRRRSDPAGMFILDGEEAVIVIGR